MWECCRGTTYFIIGSSFIRTLHLPLDLLHAVEALKQQIFLEILEALLARLAPVVRNRRDTYNVLLFFDTLGSYADTLKLRKLFRP